MDNIFQLVVNYLLIAINIKAIIIEINLNKKSSLYLLYLNDLLYSGTNLILNQEKRK
jgi:hypothetical protein